MKRIVLLVLVFSLGVIPMFSQNVAIPDTAFLAALIEEGVDTNEDSLISYFEAEAVTSPNVSSYLLDRDFFSNILDMTGIEVLVNLDSLFCCGNLSTNLYFSNNSALEFMNCRKNQLTRFDLQNKITLSLLAKSCRYHAIILQTQKL